MLFTLSASLLSLTPLYLCQSLLIQEARLAKQKKVTSWYRGSLHNMDNDVHQPFDVHQIHIAKCITRVKQLFPDSKHHVVKGPFVIWISYIAYMHSLHCIRMYLLNKLDKQDHDKSLSAEKYNIISFIKRLFNLLQFPWCLKSCTTPQFH